MVACPSCGSAGAISVNHLDRILVCKGCARHYKVNTDGQMLAMTRTPEGKWVETARYRPGGLRGLRLSRRAAVATVLLSVCLPAVWLFSRPSSASPPAELPRELGPRAELLSRAWLTQDLPLLRRLTLATYERSLFGWLRRRPPPRKLAADEAEAVQMEVSQPRKTGRVTAVTVRIRGVPGAKGLVEFHQSWEERDGTWLFLPPPR